MQLFVGLFLFSSSMHLATGKYKNTQLIVTKCETCNASGYYCSGPLVQCSNFPTYADVCSLLVSETTVGETILTTVKSCSHQRFCYTDPFSVNMGQGRIARGKVGCCIGEGTCEAPTRELPQVSSKPNGKHCPACYSLTGSCPKEVVYCTGSEDHCLNLAFTSRIGNTSSNFTMKGCTTDSVCYQLSIGYLQFGGTDVVIHESECSQAPPSMGCSLLALSGFLLMKILS